MRNRLEQKKLRLFLVEDHELMVLGLRSIFRSENWVDLVGECRDGESAIKMVPTSGADIMMINLGLPKIDGIAVTRKIAEICPSIATVWFSSHPVVQYMNTAVNLGVKGFLHKSCHAEELVQALHIVSNGGEYYSKTVFTNTPGSTGGPLILSRLLSDRQKEVLTLVGMGYVNKEIASLLGMGVRTVETHCEAICMKLKLKGRADMVRFAIKSGLTL